MDFVRILRSLEEFLYEVMTWIVFYPRTFLRTLRSPKAMARYTKRQLEQAKDDQFSEMVSPVLTLILSVLLAHGLEMMLAAPIPSNSSRLATLLFGTEQGLLATRSVIFSLYALLGALIVLTRVRTPIDRDTLREPFFIQCYLVSPFVVLLSLGTILPRVPESRFAAAGSVLTVLAVAWYVWAQSGVYRHLLGMTALRSMLLALVGFVAVTVLVSGGLVIILGLGSYILGGH